VDVSRVFPLFHLDPAVPENYDFRETDDYIAKTLDIGAKVSYRLGESIEWSTKLYRVHPPKDYEQWAKICIGIIRHYNEGWANGFRHNIEYWCIWEEPENVPQLWTGTWDDYIRLYVTAAKAIKARFPNVKVGGPAMGMGSARRELVERLLAACRQHAAPLDFFAVTRYATHPQDLIALPAVLRQLLDEHGFPATEVHISEWNYFPGDWSKIGELEHCLWLERTIQGADGAAFICAVLSGWQDTPLDMGFFYVGSALSHWGLFDPVCRKPRTNYYGMLAFARLAEYAQRVAARCAGRDTWVLAGRKAHGPMALLIACWQGPAARIVVQLKDPTLAAARCRLQLVDAVHNLAPVPAASAADNALVITKPAGSAVFLLEWA